MPASSCPGLACAGARFHALDFHVGVLAGLCSISNRTLLRGLGRALACQANPNIRGGTIS